MVDCAASAARCPQNACRWRCWPWNQPSRMRRDGEDMSPAGRANVIGGLMRVQRRVLAAACAAAIAATAGLTAQASAATIATTIPCVANLGFGGALTLPLAGSGFTPNGSITLRTATKSDPTPRDLT